MTDRNRILILGNGFDLAHFLPTKYEHFITAMCAIEDASSDKPLLFDNIFRELLTDKNSFLSKTKKIYETENINISIENLVIFKERLYKNGWFQYFKDYLDSGIDTWIDFENEIKNVLNIVCFVLNKNSDKNEIIDVKYYESNLGVITEGFFDDFNTNKSHYLNVLVKLNILQKIYVLHNDNDAEEIEESQFNDIDNEHAYDPILGFANSTYTSKQIRLKEDFIKMFNGRMTGIQVYKVIKDINDQLLGFIDIFSMYIEVVEGLVPKVKLKTPKVINGLDAIYSFNYSSTIESFYISSDTARLPRTAYLHGKAGKENTIVLGVAKLGNQLLKDEKAYGFVKYYQKLVNNTDYQFLSGNSDLINLEKEKIRTTASGTLKTFEIYIWGHSLDSSDSDYIEEIFSLNKGNEASIHLIIYYFPTPHAQLANLIDIMDKDIIEMWMKKGWLEFVKAPDIYALNNDEDYIDKLSNYSERF